VTGPGGGGEDAVRCRVGDVVRCGRAITVECPVDPARLVDAVRTEYDEDGRVAVDAPAPQPVHEHVGYVHPEMGLRTRTALARAGRTRGLTTSYDDDIAETRERLAALTVEEGTLAEHRRAAAEVVDDVDRVRERVAAARGKLDAAREHGVDAERATRELEEAVRELSEVETERAAARQRLGRARESARNRRDRRERALALEDELANLRRDARAHLCTRCWEQFAEAAAAVPGSEDPADPFDADPVTAALAVVRVASPSAPVVLACDRFDSAAAASRWLGAPVVRV